MAHPLTHPGLTTTHEEGGSGKPSRSLMLPLMSASPRMSKSEVTPKRYLSSRAGRWAPSLLAETPKRPPTTDIGLQHPFTAPSEASLPQGQGRRAHERVATRAVGWAPGAGEPIRWEAAAEQAAPMDGYMGTHGRLRADCGRLHAGRPARGCVGSAGGRPGGRSASSWPADRGQQVALGGWVGRGPCD